MTNKPADIEEGLAFTPKFDANGLVAVVVTDAKSGDVLMVAHMNEEAIRKTVASGEAWYYSRSRKTLWRKGETSGHTQRVVELRVDCDQDALSKVEQAGEALPAGARATALCRCAGGSGLNRDAESASIRRRSTSSPSAFYVC
jgi:phosphoribosyl-AMP cyclohydrolase